MLFLIAMIKVRDAKVAQTICSICAQLYVEMEIVGNRVERMKLSQRSDLLRRETKERRR